MTQFKLFDDYSEVRNQFICIHCGNGLEGGQLNREHVPTKSLFNEPYPDNLSTVQVHAQCNSDYSLDEEYVVALLASVKSGSTEHDSAQFPSAARSLKRSPDLRKRIDQTRQVRGTAIEWAPEMERVERVILKNARGHAFFELGLPLIEQPSFVGFSPISLLTFKQRAGFENIPNDSLWPEVNSRMLHRIARDPFHTLGWIDIQSGVYRYAIFQRLGMTVVRLVIYEYLAAEISWE